MNWIGSRSSIPVLLVLFGIMPRRLRETGCKMSATSTATLSIRSNASVGPKSSQLLHSKASSIKFNLKSNIRSFSGLKATNFVSSESEPSFLGTKINTAPKAKKESRKSCISASYKVVILGAAGGIGQPLALLIKMPPLVSKKQYGGISYYRKQYGANY